MERDYTDFNKNTIADYKVALTETEDKILESLRNKNIKELFDYITLYFKLSKLLEQKYNIVRKENSGKHRK